MTNLPTMWESAQTRIRAKIGDSSFQTWFSHVAISLPDDKTLILETPDEFYKTWIVDHYLDTIRTVLEEEGAGETQVHVQINPDLRPVNVPSPAEATPAPSITRTSSTINKNAAMSLQARFTFDTFVVGNSNRMTHAASVAVANNPAKAYNPLFIYGQSGLGKTHLMQSIANHIIQNQPTVRCLYLSSEQFTNEMIDAIQHKTVTAFHQKYRNNIDVLLIDDIQFIAGKRSTQEAFFHTFNDLHNSHKQIVISSDRPPKEIENLEDRLVTRFCMGLITDVQPPDFETRVAILRKKSALEAVAMPDEVIYFIAEQIKTNIRELEGALNRVRHHAIIMDRPVTVSLAKEILKDMVKETMKTISIEMVQQSVAEHFHMSVNELKSKKRTQAIALPRHIAMYLSRKLTRHSFPEIGNAFGGKDHATVLHAYKKIEESLLKKPEVKYSIEKLTALLNQ
jgi:chromosomal replication initiator protein